MIHPCLSMIQSWCVSMIQSSHSWCVSIVHLHHPSMCVHDPSPWCIPPFPWSMHVSPWSFHVSPWSISMIHPSVSMIQSWCVCMIHPSLSMIHLHDASPSPEYCIILREYSRILREYCSIAGEYSSIARDYCSSVLQWSIYAYPWSNRFILDVSPLSIFMIHPCVCMIHLHDASLPFHDPWSTLCQVEARHSYPHRQRRCTSKEDMRLGSRSQQNQATQLLAEPCHLPTVVEEDVLKQGMCCLLHCCMPSHIPLLFSSGYCVLQNFLNIRCKREMEQLKTGLKPKMFPSAHSFTHCLLSRTFPLTSLSIYAIPCFRRKNSKPKQTDGKGTTQPVAIPDAQWRLYITTRQFPFRCTSLFSSYTTLFSCFCSVSS